MRRTTLRRCMCLMATLALAVAPAAKLCAQAATAPDEISIILATPAFYSLPISVLLKTGGEYNLKVELLELQGGGEAGAVFAGGNGDILMSGIDKLFGLRRQNMVDIRVFGVILTAANWSLVAPTKANIKSIKDLKGKTIGISGPGSSSDMLVRYAVRKVGLDPDKDVTLIALGSVANLFAGVENDRVAAGVLVSPFLERAGAAGMTRVADADWERMEYPNNVFIGRTKDLETKRDKFIHFMNAFKTVLHRFKTDRDYAMKMAKMVYPNTSSEELSQQLDFAIDVLWKPMEGTLSKGIYDQAKDVLVGSGRFKPEDIPDYSAVVVTLPDK
jgi:ABC-type nitrate/sulfonate/bicarbonate transport system substrate-binding protein